MSGLPTQIPQQSVPLLQNDTGTPPQYMDINWYLWAYNISKAVLGAGGGGGTTPISPYDVLDTANLFAQTADIPQAYRRISNLAVQLAGVPLPDPVPAAQPVQAVTPGASPFIYTALANGVLSVTGGAVSNVSIIRQGVTVATGIGSSSAGVIGSLTDEKSTNGSIGFTAGVDFAAGTSTSVTLSQNYVSAANLFVAFDGGDQGGDTLSLGGTGNKVLTFNAVIPLGTQKVYVKGALPSTISASGGLVPLRRLDKVQITYTSAPTVAFLPA
jgi:hypothetical protein